MVSCFVYSIDLLAFSLVVFLVLYYGSKLLPFQILKTNISNFFLIRCVLNISLFICFFLTCYTFYLYLDVASKQMNSTLLKGFNHPKTTSVVGVFDEKLFTFKLWASVYEPIAFSGDFNGYFSFSFDLFGLIFLLLAYLVGLISFLALDTRVFSKNVKFMATCNFLILIVTFFVIINDVLLFFLLYELLLVPSFLFVYIVSPSRRSTQAALYFVIWTQIGSFLVFCAIGYIIYAVGQTSYSAIFEFNFTEIESFFLYLLFFVGFGIKVPIFPFHYWLTKTHVEAPTGFSIFLSGFLVKSALYGFYRLTNLLGYQLDNTWATVICFLGVLDSSLKMWSQTDLKKLVAYGTIQEMNLIYVAFCFGDTIYVIGGILFCVTHAFLSALFFYLVDCIQRRYNTRSVTELSGILHSTPNLGIAILIGVILYAGLPGSLKFISEVYIFTGLLETAPLTVVILMWGANFLGILGFSKSWFNVVFGFSKKFKKNPPIDLTMREALVIFLCIFFMFFFQLSMPIFV